MVESSFGIVAFFFLWDVQVKNSLLTFKHRENADREYVVR